MADADPAARRFFVLQMVRLTGVVMTVLGAMSLAGTLDLPRIAGGALMIAGVIDFFVVPILLSRAWKSRTP